MTYQGYYGLHRKPFTAQPAAIYQSEVHQEALAVLQYGLSDGKQFLAVTGEAGVGKTLVLGVFLRSLTEKVLVCHFSEPPATRADLYRQLDDSFVLKGADRNKAMALLRFGELLRGIREQEARLLLLFDNAHLLSTDLLEEIRLLANSRDSEGLLSVFFCGRPSLDDCLGTSVLASLRQRVGGQYQLRPFLLEETAGYIRYHLREAGAQRLDLFDKEAIASIQAVTGGIPHRINLLCESAMQEGYLCGIPMIRPAIVRRCARRMGLWPDSDPDPKGLFSGWLAGLRDKRIQFKTITDSLLMRIGKNTKSTVPAMEKGAHRGKGI